MNLFRNVLFWIVLALAGALIAQLLVQDPGYVLVRYGGNDYTTNVPKAMALLLIVLAALWLLWKLLSLPFTAVRRHRRRQARARLIDGFDALHQGQWTRAEKLLGQAAEEHDAVAVAHVGAARAALGRGDESAARVHLAAIDANHSATRAIAEAELALSHDRPADALVLLDAPSAQPLPPRGLVLRGEALATLGRSGEAYGLLGALRQQQALSDERLSMLEARWGAASLREAADANVLADRWEALPKALRHDPASVAAYAERASAMRWDEAATRSIEQALDARWDESLANLYGRLPVGRVAERREHAERWLQAHPASPALLLTLARLSRAQGQWPQAEAWLHRALAQGANSEAWEELGAGFAQTGEEKLARQCYANALSAARGEAISDLPGRDLRQTIFDQAVAEERDEHGVPRLRE
ncbi:heme biosynthesis HemY N-terminal domain-containing protein [Lysobacter sp. LF1]|uniref:Heme biosynthesis HemY N-terminal domain-containing protein n=1 Tax=Lysobacter stagni TaxID=3045172 RepID=A0ABT6XCT3_9GAMM|nr:heme biosynthesis HemY N-terminal domain-containing protein [Lysobacter sp. LF1]MDI9237953.1 heme biosynthesis HemY N-terminal domain-containing protein [Lysobacter sp. LF1]